MLHALWIATALRVLLPSFADPDLWGHILFGSLLLTGTLPEINGFAYTAAAHPWINHELLAEISMASVFNAGGAPGLIALKVMVGLGTMLIVWRTALRRTGHTGASAIATAAVAVGTAPGFMIRPQIFTLLFLASTLGVLARADYRPRGQVWWLPLLFVVWINTHGGVIAGLGLAGIGLGVGLACRWRAGIRSRADVAASGALLAALGAALLVNPWGIALIRFLLTDVTPAVSISEWAPVSLTDRSFPFFKLLLVLVAAQSLLGRAIRPPEAAVALVAGVAAVLHQRHIPLFMIAAAPIVAVTLADGWQWLATRQLDRFARAGCGALAGLQVVLAAGAGWSGGGRVIVNPWDYPVQAVRFLVQNEIAGNVALPFRWGEYALWSLPPGSRVAVDGRFTTAYPPELLDAAWSFMSGGPGWDALLTDYPTDIVITDRVHAPASLLQDHADWAYVYSDPVSMIFLRRDTKHAATLARLRAGTLRYDDAPLDTAFPGAFRGGIDHAVRPSAACRLAGPVRPGADAADLC
jgi:hypothetical protein